MLSEDTHSRTYASHRSAFKKDHSQQHIEHLSVHTLETFKQIARQYALFHIVFFALGLLELFAFVLFFSFLTQSAIFAFTIAGLFFTGFAYFVLLFYFQAKKPQQLLDLKDNFIAQFKTIITSSKEECDYHTAQINTLYLLLSLFHRQEYTFYPLSQSFKTLSLLAKKFSVWTHWKDVHQFKEILLKAIVGQYVNLVQLKPTDLEIHAGLATAFLSLSKLYLDPRKIAPGEEHLFVSADYHSEEMNDKFKNAASRAIEELHILDTYAPNDPWVHSQLASVYQDLELTDKEIEEYEAILKLAPKDHEILFRLGVLYFSQGRNAQALNLYEKLKDIQESRAEELLSYYGAAFIDDAPVAKAT